MKTIDSTRLLKSGWKQSINTSTHKVWYKKDWACFISHSGQVKFSRMFSKAVKIDTVDLMRGPVEKGIE